MGEGRLLTRADAMTRPFLQRLMFLVASLALVTACPKGPRARPPDPDAVYVYTSLYPEVIAAIRPAVDAELAKVAPGMRVEWVQGGSSRLRRRLDRELARWGGSPAEILLTSDPSHYAELAAKGHLLPYASPAAAGLPPEARAADHAWVTARYSAMVIGVVPGHTSVQSFEDLAGKKLKEGALSIGDPDFSGTNLVTVARLSERLGWDYYETLKARGVVVAGSNSMVMERLETGTTDAGIVLLENLLAAKARSAKVDPVFPEDGAVIVPGPIALLERAGRSRGAKAVYDAILSPGVQALLVKKGFLYAADPKAAPPAGAPDLGKLLGGAELASAFAPIEGEAVRSRFAALFTREAVAPPTASPAPSPEAAPAASPTPAL